MPPPTPLSGDLGAIDASYDVAVSTAVGALDYIVVDTAADAQRCVELLRKGNLGVATFLILEKQAHLASAMAQRVEAPEGVQRRIHHVCSSNWRQAAVTAFAVLAKPSITSSVHSACFSMLRCF